MANETATNVVIWTIMFSIILVGLVVSFEDYMNSPFSEDTVNVLTGDRSIDDISGGNPVSNKIAIYNLVKDLVTNPYYVLEEIPTPVMLLLSFVFITFGISLALVIKSFIPSYD